MMKSLAAVLVLFLASTATAEAQRRLPRASPETWLTIQALMYTDVSRVTDPGTETRWVFDDQAFGFGAGLHRQVIPGLALGLDGTWASVDYEQRLVDLEVVTRRGTASLATAMATGRYGGGGDGISFNLIGGIGAVAYKLEGLDWNADFALHAGTGLEYRFQRNRALALEWGRIWGYHEKEDLGGPRQTHSLLRLAFRLGF